MESTLKDIDITKDSINSILEVFEATSTFVPSSTNKGEIGDISIFDHSKMTAAIGTCILDYLDNSEIDDYRIELFINSKKFYSKKSFLMLSIDISGIQDFIYTISSKGALKGLRARSFYLEVLLENIIDNLLNELEYSRANLIYSGGGDAYVLIANTKVIKDKINKYFSIVNRWFLKEFGTSLYIASYYCECSASQLGMGSPEEYKEIFKNLSEGISNKKLNRYSAEEIMYLNNGRNTDKHRECIICHRSDKLTEENKCTICSNLENLSDKIIKRGTFFLVMKYAKEYSKFYENKLIISENQYLIPCEEDEALKFMVRDEYVRVYSKNKWYKGINFSTKLWVGDYIPNLKGYTFEDLAQKSTGIKRLCVLRADIDNLGQAFVSGYKDEHVSLSRVSTFSRKLSIFFKKHINYILEHGKFSFFSEKNNLQDIKRDVMIVYSGGDDIFIVGAWNDVIDSAVYLHNSLKKFSQMTLTISAGVGIFPPKFPIATMAKKSGELEDQAKSYIDLNGKFKNAITLFDEKFTFSWEEFINNVLNDKYITIRDFFESNIERGKNFMYNLLDYIKEIKDKINIARFAYLLARMEPDKSRYKKEDYEIEYRKYKEFRNKMYGWISDTSPEKNKNILEVELALYLYVYLKREKE